MTEFKSIKWVALKLFYAYKMLGVVTIPLITVLFIFSTANLLSSGAVTNGEVDVLWAIVYAVCFEMNGLRLVIDAKIKQINKQAGVSVDYALGVFLVSIGVSTTFIEGMVNSKVIQWDDLKGVMWIILGVRSIAILGMIIRECIHYAPLVMSVVALQELREEREVQNVRMEKKSEIGAPMVKMPALTVALPQASPDVVPDMGMEEKTNVTPEVQEEKLEPRKIDDVMAEDKIDHKPTMEFQCENEPDHEVDEQIPLREAPIAINYGDKILAYLSENPGATNKEVAEFAGCSTKTVERKRKNLAAIQNVANFR